MGSVLVDSNVLIDVATDDTEWAEWSIAALAEAGDHDVLVINPIIFAEVSVRYSTIEELEEALPVSLFRRESIPFEAAFLAGKAFVRHRAAGGTRTSPLPDFYIGAHAAVANHRLLTRDATRYRTYFPTVDLISP
jgi:hypothetical protein